jgi:hypothetical protein
VLLIDYARQGWCHWLATTNLEQLATTARVVELFGSLGTEIYINDEPLANPPPDICSSCGDARADVSMVGAWSLCRSCTEQVDSRELVRHFVLDHLSRSLIRNDPDFNDYF